MNNNKDRLSGSTTNSWIDVPPSKSVSGKLTRLAIADGDLRPFTQVFAADGTYIDGKPLAFQNEGIYYDDVKVDIRPDPTIPSMGLCAALDANNNYSPFIQGTFVNQNNESSDYVGMTWNGSAFSLFGRKSNANTVGADIDPQIVWGNNAHMRTVSDAYDTYHVHNKFNVCQWDGNTLYTPHKTGQTGIGNGFIITYSISEAWIVQICFAVGENRLWMRSCNNGTWTGWCTTINYGSTMTLDGTTLNFWVS